ncbi:SH3 domain-containing protein [Streptomyces sp. NBC_00400]|uniref:SH3 domain-containing protein n=1 Tax=Streptomyces sp. NBC_00400 TaxID=2975737 RepID=UPI002E24058F
MRALVKTAASVSAGALGLLGLAAAPSFAAESVSAKAGTCYVYNATKGTLNVRSGPGERYSTIGTIAKGGKLRCGSLQDTTIKGSWYSACGGSADWTNVRISGQDGWVAAECVGFGV